MRNIQNSEKWHTHPFEEQIKARFGQLRERPELRLQLFTTISGKVLAKTELTSVLEQYDMFEDTYEADDERLCELLDLKFDNIQGSEKIEQLKGAHSIQAETFLRQIRWGVAPITNE
jgi:hypothetical protein